jgi:hypothetical protein
MTNKREDRNGPEHRNRCDGDCFDRAWSPTARGVRRATRQPVWPQGWCACRSKIVWLNVPVQRLEATGLTMARSRGLLSGRAKAALELLANDDGLTCGRGQEAHP